MVQVPQLHMTGSLNAGRPVVAAVFVFDAVVTVVDVTAVVFRLAVAAAVVVVVLCAAAAAELPVAVSAVEAFVIGALVVHDVAVAAAGLQALLRAVARGHCFVAD